MTKEISNSDDYIDSRDVIARITELERQEADEQDNDLLIEAGVGDDPEPQVKGYWFDEDEAEELAALRALVEEADGYVPDWLHGATLIRDSYFKEYAQELAQDIGACQPVGWPSGCIDWDRAVDELQQDYTSVEWSGVTYWVR